MMIGRGGRRLRLSLAKVRGPAAVEAAAVSAAAALALELPRWGAQLAGGRQRAEQARLWLHSVARPHLLLLLLHLAAGRALLLQPLVGQCQIARLEAAGRALAPGFAAGSSRVGGQMER